MCAAKKPIDYRQTIFVPVGQKTLMLEAPQGMCFLDQTSSSGRPDPEERRPGSSGRFRGLQ
ncbi:MAG: hypothetical protein V1721_09845 [Pseudomonadota bacterium]